MKRNHLFILFGFVLIAALTGCKKESSTPEDPPPDATQHDNLVFIQPFYFAPSSMAYVEINHSITGGQPWGGVTVSIQSNQIQIDAKAGRHASSSVADWFKSNASSAACTANCTCDWPSELNFAFTGTITIDGDSYPVTIGQGSTAGANNWWIGGPGWVIHEGTYENVMTPDRKYCFLPMDNESDIFKLQTSYSVPSN